MASTTDDHSWFETIFELAPDGYYLCDLTGTFIAGNEAAESIVGFPRDELIGKNFLSLKLLSAADLPRAAKLLALSAAGQMTGPDELTLNRKDGSQVIVEVRSRPVTLNGRKLVLGIARDITERKQTQAQLNQALDELERRVDERTEQLQQANAQLRAEIEERKKVESTLLANQRRLQLSLNATRTSCWEVNLQTGELVAQHPTIDWLGYAPEEIPNNRDWWKSLIHPDDTDVPSQALAEHVAGRADGYHCEYRVRGKNGEWFWTLDRGRIVEYDDQGEPLVIAGTDTDITERKRAEEARSVSEQHFRRLFNTARDAILIADMKTGRIVDANSAAVELMATPRDELLGKHQSQLHPPEEAERYRQIFAEHIDNSASLSVDAQIQRPSGEQIPVELAANVFEVDDREYIQGIFRDISERKRISEELTRRERLYNKAIAVAEAVAYQLDFASNSYVHIDAQIEELLGYAASEFTPAAWDEISRHAIVRGEFAHLSLAEARRQHREGQFNVWQADYECVTRDGQTIWLSDSSVLLRDEQGTPTGSLGILQNITARKRAAQQLEEFNVALSNAMPGIAQLDLDRRFVQVNDYYARVLGYQPEELIGVAFGASIVDADRNRAMQAYEAMQDSGKSEFEAQGVRNDGSLFHMQILLTQMNDADGTHVGNRCFMRDISDRKQAEAAILRSERQFRSVFEQAGVAVGIVESKSGRIVRINDKYEQLIGYSNAEVTEKTWMEITHPDDVQPDLENMDDLADGRLEQFTMEKRLIHKNGSVIWINLTVSPLWNDGDNFNQHIVIIEDITARKQADIDIEVRAQQQAVIVQLGQRVLVGDSIAELFQVAMGLATAALDVGLSMVLHLSPDNRELRFDDCLGWNDSLMKERVIPVTPQSQAGFTILTNAPVVVDHLPSDVRFEMTQAFKEHQVVSGATVVIQGQSKPYGVFGVHTNQPRAFSPRDVSFLQTIANTLGEAIERSRVVEALVKSEQRLQLVTDAMPAFVSYLHANRCYGFVNSYYEEMFGIAREEIIGKPVWEILDKDVYQTIEPRIDSALAGQRQQFESTLALPNIGMRTLSTEYLPDISPEGVVRGYYTLAVDITERKQSEVAIRQSEHRLRMITEHIPAYIAYLDANERFQYVNQRNAEFKGLTLENIIGTQLADVIPTERYRKLQPKIRRVLAGETVEFETTSDYARHGTLTIHSSFVPDIDLEGNVCGYYSFTTDITKRRRAEQQARERLDQLAHVMRLATAGEMATGLAHELNQPLSASVTYADICLNMIESKTEETAQLKPILSSLKQQTLRASEIVRRMRSYVKKEQFYPSTCATKELLDNVLALLTFELSSEDIRVDVTIPANGAKVYVDQVQIEQVLLNLLRNAIESIADNDFGESEHGRIEIEVAAYDNSFVVLTIRDTGGGVSAEESSKVFDAFYSTKPKGMGMGLAICRTIVEAHSGSIQLISDGNGGATFQLKLPKATEQQVLEATTAAEH